MNTISNNIQKKIDRNMRNGIKTIFVEGVPDVHIYKRFYPNACFICGNSCDSIVKKMRELNNAMGKTPLVVAIIDKDLKSSEEIETLAKENIFTLGLREIESIFLKKEVITKLFGLNFFQEFSKNIQENAQNRTSIEINDYDEALEILKKSISSKYSIRLLLKQLGVHNKGNSKNIEFLCSKMDESKLWYLVLDSIPKIERFRNRRNDFERKRKF